jgi:hypothetical protein
MQDIIFSFTRNKIFKKFNFYKEENSRNFFNLVNYSIYRASLFGKVYVYTTESEIDNFKENINTAEVIFKIIPENETFFWAMSKFVSIRDFIKEYNKPCLHIDFDLFLNQKFILHEPNLIISHGEPYTDTGAKILDEYGIPKSCFLDFYNTLHNRIINDNISENATKWLELGYTYNTSIFGGFDTSLILRICEQIISTVNNDNHKMIEFVKQEDPQSIIFTAVWEQAYLAYICKHLEVIPASYGWHGNYFHFFSETKNKPAFVNKLNEIISEKKYILVTPDQLSNL